MEIARTGHPTLRDIAEHLTGEARGLGEIAPRVRPAGRAYIDDNIIKFLAGARDTVGRIPLKQRKLANGPLAFFIS